MSSETFYPPWGNREPYIATLHLRLNIGSAGSVLSTSRYRGVASVTRNSTGDYTLTLSQAYKDNSFLGMQASYNVNSTTPSELKFQIYSVDEDAKTIKFKCLTGTTPTAADPGSGSTLFLWPAFMNTSNVAGP